MDAIATITGADRLAGYLFFWARAVTGFNEREHCAKCLTGWMIYSEAYGKVSQKSRQAWPMNTPTPLPLGRAPVGYICGVSSSGYAYNVHAPFEVAWGESFTVDLGAGQTLLMEHARRLPIPPLARNWGGLSPAFTTCRNFQFAVSRFGMVAPQPALVGLGAE